MKTKKVIVVIFGTIFINSALAGDDGMSQKNTRPQVWKKVVSLSMGPAWSSTSQTQTIDLQPSLMQTYVANSNTQAFGSGELFFGLQHAVMPRLQAQLGLAIAGTTSIQLNGNVWQDADPDLNNFSYDYQIKHEHIAVKGKLLTDIYQLLQPYISGSLGVGYNHAYNYTSIPKLVTVPSEPPFTSHTTTAFTYTLGAGVQRALNEQWAIGMGYEFADWGQSHLGAASDQVSNSGLHLSHIYTNQLQFSLNFIA